VNRSRFWVVIAGLTLCAVGVVARTVQVMVVQHATWSQRARRQHERVIQVPGPRGDILTADGYVLATSVDRLAVQLDTNFLMYPELFVDAAAPMLGISKAELSRRLTRGPRTLWLAQRLERHTAEAIRALAPDAVILVPDAQRIYPLEGLAAPVIGFVGREELQTVGRAGYEHYYDTLLAGEPETYLAVNDAIQRRLRLERLSQGRAGFDLSLTLLAPLQAACEAELDRAIAEYRASSGSVLAMEVETGDLIAVASLPGFDPNWPGNAPSSNWRLRPIQNAVEPGSLVKPVIAAAALAAGVVRPGESFDCRSRGTRVAGHWMRDHAEPGVYTLDEVVAVSANTGIIEVAQRVPPQRLWQAFDAFGFGRQTGVGFPAEAAGILPPTRRWSKMSRASLALGQELTASPLQLAVAYAAIANGGWLVTPNLVARADGPRSFSTESRPHRLRVLDEKLCARLQRMLEMVITEGTGSEAQVSGFSVAGKTGTAQRAVNGSFDDRHHIAWFAGFLPQSDPRVVVVVAIEDPMTDFWGSSVAAPVFARIAETLVCQLGMAPERAIADFGGSA
jgi:cell division protein FtsI/penicillin-binding protein 2